MQPVIAVGEKSMGRRLAIALSLAVAVTLVRPLPSLARTEGDVPVDMDAIEQQSAPVLEDIVGWTEYAENGSSIRWKVDAEGVLTLEPLYDTTGVLELCPPLPVDSPTLSEDGDGEKEHAVVATPWYDYRESITSFTVRDDCTIECRGLMVPLFAGCHNLVRADLSRLDMRAVTDASSMFEGSFLREVKLGENFAFTAEGASATLPVPQGEECTGKWMRVGDDGSLVGPILASEELRDSWEASLAGTWVWEVTPQEPEVEAVVSADPVQDGLPADGLPADEPLALPADQIESVPEPTDSPALVPMASDNTTRETAKTIAVPSTVNESFTRTSSYYWYKLTLPSCGRLRVNMKTSVDGYYYRICDAGGEFIPATSITGNGSPNVVSNYFDLTKGTYYIRLQAKAGSYTMGIAFTKSSESFAEAQSGSNNTMATASAISLGTKYTGQIALNDDKDFYKLTLPSAGYATISFSGKLQVKLELYDASQSKLKTIYPEKDSETGAVDYKIGLHLTKGTYYLLVGRHLYEETGGYALQVDFVSAGESFAEAQGGSNNTMAKASAISLGKTYKGQLALNDETDYYKFTLTREDPVVVFVKAVSAESMGFISEFTILDASGNKKWNKKIYLDADETNDEFSERVSLGKGTYYLSVGGFLSVDRGNYSFSIAEVTSLEGATISGISNATYTGEAITPKPTVQYGGKTLKLNTDYSLSYKNNVNAGTATVTITGKGSYGGTKSVTFAISKADIASSTVASITDKAYTGKAIEPKLTVKYGDKTLTLNTDYTVTYKDNVNAGTATATVTGKGNYAGTKSVTFKISKIDIAKATILGVTNARYTGKAIEPKPVVRYADRTLILNTDYTLAYKNNVNVGGAIVTVTGKGNYTGSKSVTFAIVRGTGGWKRLAGRDRYDTMAAIVQERFLSANWAVVAYGQNFPDALAAAPLAGRYSCPVILTEGGSLSTQARSELERLRVRHVYIMGGTSVVSQNVEAELSAMSIEVKRVAGADRQQTSAKALQELASTRPTTVVVATGTSYADTLSIGPWCYRDVAPILLTGWDGKLTDEQVKAIKACSSVTNVVIVGGTNAVSSDVEKQLSGYRVERLAGADRYATSALVAKWEMQRGMGVFHVAVATGANFPDALAGAALCGSTESVLLLSLATEYGSVALRDVLAPHAAEVSQGYVLGGESAVPRGTLDYLRQLTQ